LREITRSGPATDKYWYNHTGLRFKTEEGNDKYYRMYAGNSILFEEKYTSDTYAESRLNILVGDQVLGQIRDVSGSGESTYFFGLDNLGSRRIVWTSTGTVTEEFSYSAWGELTHVVNNGKAYLASFTGKEYDATGLLYFNARYYDPQVGRFLTEDPSRKGASWYTYCNNNPLRFTDPTGRRLSESGRDMDETEREITRTAAAPQTRDRRKDRRDRDQGARDLFRNPAATPGYGAGQPELGYHPDIFEPPAPHGPERPKDHDSDISKPNTPPVPETPGTSAAPSSSRLQTGYERVAAAEIAVAGAATITAGTLAIATVTVAGIVTGAAAVVLGAGIVAVGWDVAEGGGTDKTIAVIQSLFGKK
jgi:RHS repeat-associated protein